MYVVHAIIKVKTGREEAAQSVFEKPFKPAISAQPGFKCVEFLKPSNGGEYVLAIAFESKALQQNWVATELHMNVWSQMETNFENYAIKTYDTI
jgi:heme-degrading monooxygenase HmoA